MRTYNGWAIQAKNKRTSRTKLVVETRYGRDTVKVFRTKELAERAMKILERKFPTYTFQVRKVYEHVVLADSDAQRV